MTTTQQPFIINKTILVTYLTQIKYSTTYIRRDIVHQKFMFGINQEI